MRGRKKTFAVDFTDPQRAELLRGQRCTTLPAGLVRRGRLILLLSGIRGPGAANLNVQRSVAAPFIIFIVNTGAPVTISGLTISNGLSLGPNGAGVMNLGSLTLQNSTISGNTAPSGGGLYNAVGASLTVQGCTISSNQATAGNGAGLRNFGVLLVQNSSFTGNFTGVGAGGGGVQNDPGGTATVQNSSFTNNSVTTTGGGDGGGINSFGAGRTLTVQGCTFTTNSCARFGGAIHVFGGNPVTITGCTFTGNMAGPRGGGLQLAGTTATVSNCTFNTNQATNGGGIDSSAMLTVQNSTLSGNTATANGGGIDNYGGGTLTVLYTTLSGNSAFAGGGIANNLSTATVQNSTLSGNSAAFGGGMASSGTLTVQNSTLSGNIATTNGGGIVNVGGTLNLTNALIAYNTNAAAPDVSGTVTFAASYNTLVRDGTGTMGIATGDGHGNLVGTAANPINPLLGPLQNNGGLVPTFALLPGSPAIDAGNNAFVTGPFDDRGPGFNRIINGRVDIGGFEFQPPTTTTTVISSANPSSLGQGLTFTATVAGIALGSNTPQGTVTFFIDGTPQVAVGLVNGTASFSTSALSAGSHAIAARFDGFRIGDYVFNASLGSVAQMVNAPPVPPPPPVNYIVAGTDAGSPTEVRVFDAATKRLKFDLFPFVASFLGGARVAVGDVNRDGVPDIVVGAGPGGGPQVRVYDGKTGLPFAGFLGSFYGLSPSSFMGGVWVAAGDVNGDGFADVIVGADAGGGPQVQVFSGKDGKVLFAFNALSADFLGGVRVAAADVNGDGRADIIAGAGLGGGPQVTVYSGKDLTILQSFFAFAPTFGSGVFVAGGAADATGKAAVFVGAGAGGGPQVNVFAGGVLRQTLLDTGLDLSPAAVVIPGGVRVGLATINSRATLLTATGATAPPRIDLFNGQTLASLDLFFAFAPNFLDGLFVAG